MTTVCLATIYANNPPESIMFPRFLDDFLDAMGTMWKCIAMIAAVPVGLCCAVRFIKWSWEL